MLVVAGKGSVSGGIFEREFEVSLKSGRGGNRRSALMGMLMFLASWRRFYVLDEWNSRSS